MTLDEKLYLGVDVGSISTNLALINDKRELVNSVYIRTEGRPIDSVQKAVRIMKEDLNGTVDVAGVGTTGSARYLTGLVVGADIVKNEITAHALASLHYQPDIQTIIEIGGQDSKIIIIRDGVAIDFAMNSVCAAGTGSFLDMQAKRLEIPIEQFGDLASESNNAVSIAGRCTVFAESDMIHKQQLGHKTEDIIKGLCEALARNYLNNVAKGKEILPPIMFQGGVAANKGMREAFQKFLNQKVIVPKHYAVMGAIGAAILAQEEIAKHPRKSSFYGWNIPETNFETSGFECDGCPNVCEIVEIKRNGDIIARWGSRCGKWDIVEKKDKKEEVQILKH
jgi:predicted CoA-substrate-specific enzyme activase